MDLAVETVLAEYERRAGGERRSGDVPDAADGAQRLEGPAGEYPWPE